MYLKSLTLRGFKSFASATECSFDSSLNVIVGPNGSGKSNIVDALAWVLGDQSAKAQRGSSMQDVVFAGTVARPALGRAKVTLVLDNSDGSLDFPASEISIERTMFRGGGSEYSVNGTAVRLGDIQGFLAQAQIVQGEHTIVGQGQVDRILSASASERREIFEEAFGIHIHRRRASQSERKLDSMKQNLDRLEDLETELASQLAPLKVQAEAAQKAGELTANIESVRSQLMALEAEELQRILERSQTLRDSQLKVLEIEAQKILSVQVSENSLEERLRTNSEELSDAQSRSFRVNGLLAEIRASKELACERIRSFDRFDVPDRSEEQRYAQESLEEVETQRKALSAQLIRWNADSDEAKQEEEELTQQLTLLREKLAKSQSAQETARIQHSELLAQVASERAILERSERAIEELQQEISEDQKTHDGFEKHLQALSEQRSERARELTEAEDNFRQQQKERALLRESREESLTSLHHHKQILTSLTSQREIFVQELENYQNKDASETAFFRSFQVEPQWELAVSQALSHLSSAKVVESEPGEISEGTLVFPPLSQEKQSDTSRKMKSSAEFLTISNIVVEANSTVREILTAATRGILFVEDAPTAASCAMQNPGRTFIDRDGNMFTDFARVPYRAALSNPLELSAQIRRKSAEIETCNEKVQKAEARVNELNEAIAKAKRTEQNQAKHVGKLTASKSELQAQMAAAQANATSADQTRNRRREQLQLAIQQVEVARNDWLLTRKKLEESKVDELKVQSERLSFAVEKSHEELTKNQLRNSIRFSELNHRKKELKALDERKDLLQKELADFEATSREAEAQALKVRTQSKHLQSIIFRLDALEHQLTGEKDELVAQLQELSETRATLTAQRKEITPKLESMRVTHQETQVKYQHSERNFLLAQLNFENLAKRSIEAVSHTPQELLEKYLPVSASAEELSQQLAELEQAERQLGVVNPLALTEYEALQERHSYLTQQIADLKQSRSDVRSLIKNLNQHIQMQFAEKFEKVSESFSQIFSELFEGGEGSLSLTDPQHLIESGIEVHARPSGKKVKRLSLLSGGERTLASFAFLASIFTVQPAPFYVLDEVEAALDDRNLARLHTLLKTLAEHSQLIIVTHRPRTVELGNILLGVSMQDGVSRVISQSAEQMRNQLS